MSMKFLFLVMSVLLTACSATTTLPDADQLVIQGNINNITDMQTRAQWREQLHWPKFCDDGVSHITSNVENFVGVELYDWLADKKLLVVTCEVGPYQQGQLIYLETKLGTGQFELIDFPQFTLIDAKTSSQYHRFSDPLLSGKLYVDHVKGVIRNDHFYRADGGCGVSTTYSLFATGSKVRAEVVSLSTKASCDETSRGISEWQKHFKSEYLTWPEYR